AAKQVGSEPRRAPTLPGPLDVLSAVVVVRGRASAVLPGGDGVLPGLQVGGVSVGELAELVVGGGRGRGELVSDLDLAVAARGGDGDGHGAGPFAGGHAGIRDPLARCPAGHDPDCVLAVSVGFEDGAGLGVVGGGGREAWLPAVHPVLFPAWG